MVMVSVIYHAFSFLHTQIDELLGNPDSIFNVEGIDRLTILGNPDSIFNVEGIDR